MGEVLPQGNPPKNLRGQPRTLVRLRTHEKAQRWNQHPGDRHREEKGDDVGSEVRVKMIEKRVKAMAALSEMAVPFLSVIGRILGERLLGMVIVFCRSCRYALLYRRSIKYTKECRKWHLYENEEVTAT